MKLKVSTKIIIAAVILTVIAVLFFIFALQHPEMSLPISLRTHLIIYSVYILVTVILYILGIFLHKKNK